MKTQEQALYSLSGTNHRSIIVIAAQGLKRKLHHPLQLCRPLLVACAKFSYAAAAAATHCDTNLSTTNWRNFNATIKWCILLAPAQIHHTSSAYNSRFFSSCSTGCWWTMLGRGKVDCRNAGCVGKVHTHYTTWSLHRLCNGLWEAMVASSCLHNWVAELLDPLATHKKCSSWPYIHHGGMH